MALLLNSKMRGTDVYWKDMMEEEQGLGESQIQKSFVGATVLITGGTGFLGKLIIEKLLRCCPGIKKIIMCARPKKGKDIQKRIEEQFDDVVYSKLKKQQPNFTRKITVVSADMSQPNLGLSETDRQLITDEVTYIFHCAATVRFDEPLKTAVAINVRGTREMMLLAKDCTELTSMVHVSTAYSNAHLEEIEEKFYDTNLSGDQLIDLVESLDSDTLANITPGIIGKDRNIYTYTKAVAENVVLQYSTGLPVAVVRPSIVVGTSKEPLEGWIDNVYGPSGIGVLSGLGVLRVMHLDPAIVVDMVPGDTVINTCIGVAWRVANGGKNAASPPLVYMAGTSSRTPITWRDYQRISEENARQVPSVHAVYIQMIFLIPSKFWYSVVAFFLHWIPAYLVDGALYLIGKKPRLVEAYRKIEKFQGLMATFNKRLWTFYNQNTISLYEDLNRADQELFNFDYNSHDWDEYLRTHVRGLRAYITKESPDTIPEGLKRQHALKIIHVVVCIVYALSFALLLWSFYKLLF